MKDAIKALLSSKRVIAGVVGAAGWAILQVANGRFQIGLSEESLNAVLYPVVAYILGQSWKDGKVASAKPMIISAHESNALNRIAIAIAEDQHKRTAKEITTEIAAYKGALGG